MFSAVSKQGTRNDTDRRKWGQFLVFFRLIHLFKHYVQFAKDVKNNPNVIECLKEFDHGTSSNGNTIETDPLVSTFFVHRYGVFVVRVRINVSFQTCLALHTLFRQVVYKSVLLLDLTFKDDVLKRIDHRDENGDILTRCSRMSVNSVFTLNSLTPK